MFTGIISHLGKVIDKTGTSLTIETDIELLNKLNSGMSIALNGVCLTIVAFNNNSFSIDFMPETAKITNIRYLQKEALVNLELPATPNSFLTGHIVQGHIDTVGKILNIEESGNSKLFTFSIPKNISRYIVKKGSIAVNGISLTVIEITDNSFTVGIIPYTWEKTMLHAANVDDYVNLEVDVFAKYLEKLIAKFK